MNQERIHIAESAHKLCIEKNFDLVEILDQLGSNGSPSTISTAICVTAITVLHNKLVNITDLNLTLSENEINEAIKVFLSCYIYDQDDKKGFTIAIGSIIVWTMMESIPTSDERNNIIDAIQRKRTEASSQVRDTQPIEFFNFFHLLESLKQYDFSQRDIGRARTIWKRCHDCGIAPEICGHIALYWLKDKYDK